MVHDIEPAALLNGMPLWTCACGRRFWSHQGARRHITNGSWRVPLAARLGGGA